MIKPVFRLKRPVLYAVLDVVEKELDRLQPTKVIQPTNYTPWTALIVVVKKASARLFHWINYLFRYTSIPITNTRRPFYKAKWCNVFCYNCYFRRLSSNGI